MRAKTVILLTICLCILMGCSSAKETVPQISTPSETSISSETIVSNESPEENVTVQTQETTADDSDVPYIVLEEAEAWAAEAYEYYRESASENNYSDWRIESREYCYTYEDFDGMILHVFRINIEFLSDTPESVTLIGGMSISEDGWVVPDYPNSRYLIFQQDGKSLVFLARMIENDCEPGDETFANDLEQHLGDA